MSREAGKDNSIAVRARRVLRTGAAIALSAALGVASPFPARAQEAEPGALITQDCSRGGFGEITV